MTELRGEPVDPMKAHWFAKPNDLIGGWCVMPVDAPPFSGVPEVADFASQEIAEHVADLHNRTFHDLSELTAAAMENPTPRMLKVIARAEELGWTTGVILLRLQMSKPDDKPDRAGAVARPFYATWELRGWTPTGKASWGFRSSCTSALQPLSEGDILAYLADPSVVLPEPPEGS